MLKTIVSLCSAIEAAGEKPSSLLSRLDKLSAAAFIGILDELDIRFVGHIVIPTEVEIKKEDLSVLTGNTPHVEIPTPAPLSNPIPEFKVETPNAVKPEFVIVSRAYPSNGTADRYLMSVQGGNPTWSTSLEEALTYYDVEAAHDALTSLKRKNATGGHKTAVIVEYKDELEKE